MDKLKEIFNSIKDRLTNPLVFSFICTWLIINWKVTIALLWYNQDLIKSTDSKSLFEFIQVNINYYYGFKLPICIAIGYTILMPLIKAGISVLYAWIDSLREKGELYAARKGKIGIEKYLSLRNDYNERTKILQATIEQERESIEALTKSQTDLLRAQQELNNANLKIAEKDKQIGDSTNVRFLDGYWNNHFENNDGTKGDEPVFIEAGAYFVIENGKKNHKFKITDFHYNSNNSSIFFVKELVDSEKTQRPRVEHLNNNRLDVQGDNLVGQENGNTQIVYSRQKPPTGKYNLS